MFLQKAQGPHLLSKTQSHKPHKVKQGREQHLCFYELKLVPLGLFRDENVPFVKEHRKQGKIKFTTLVLWFTQEQQALFTQWQQ